MAGNHTPKIEKFDNIEHTRARPGMYIGKVGTGSTAEDGIYTMLREILNNSVEEYRIGSAKSILIEIGVQSVSGQEVKVQDFGKGIPLDAMVDCAAKINITGKFHMGKNGVGLKAVNALSSNLILTTQRDGKAKTAYFAQGRLTETKTYTPRKRVNQKQ